MKDSNSMTLVKKIVLSEYFSEALISKKVDVVGLIDDNNIYPIAVNPGGLATIVIKEKNNWYPEDQKFTWLI